MIEILRIVKIAYTALHKLCDNTRDFIRVTVYECIKQFSPIYLFLTLIKI